MNITNSGFSDNHYDTCKKMYKDKDVEGLINSNSCLGNHTLRTPKHIKDLPIYVRKISLRSSKKINLPSVQLQHQDIQ